MFGRIVVLAAALTIAHLLTVTLCVGAYVGAARAVRDLPDRNPVPLRIVRAAGDGLMLPTSVVWWLWRGERFPDSTLSLLFTSPIWGCGLAYLLKGRRRNSQL